MVAFCKEPCADTIFKIKDQLGNLIEAANNSAGIFSALQGPPRLLPMVSRATFYCPLNRPFVLLCPGSLFIDSPIEWFVNKTIRIIPWVVNAESNGRVQIDSRERLTFRSVQKEDERIYSCWQRGQIAGIVRLVPYDSNAISIDHHIILAGIITILAVFVYLAVRIYLNKKRAAL
uniref:Ig-like domain-containing protein n=2 Tax=Rhodnius prolixus TaxID=13249 RepID=A0A4P6D8H1_RHOPR